MSNKAFDAREKSIFHTCEIRESKTNVHLIVILFCFISSLGIAIWFAETSNKKFPVAQNNWSKKSMEDQHNQ